jgi:hypothetical protein
MAAVLTPLAAALPALLAGGARAAEIALPPDAGAPPATTTVVSLSIDDAAGILGTDLVLTYDPGVARPTGVFLTTLSASHSLTFNESPPGVLRVSMYGVGPLEGGGSLIDVSFESVGPAGSRTDLHFGGADLNEGSIPTMVVDGSYCVRGAPAETTRLIAGRVPGSTLATLAWDPHPVARTYNVYRATAYGASDLACLIPGVTVPATIDDGAVPQTGRAFYYLVTAVGCDGESPPGHRSNGAPIPNPAPCGP